MACVACCAQVTGRILIHFAPDGSAPAAQNFVADDVLSAAQIIDVERASLPAHVLSTAYCTVSATGRARSR
jgi:hypothetical protein